VAEADRLDALLDSDHRFYTERVAPLVAAGWALRRVEGRWAAFARDGTVLGVVNAAGGVDSAKHPVLCLNGQRVARPTSADTSGLLAALLHDHIGRVLFNTKLLECCASMTSRSRVVPSGALAQLLGADVDSDASYVFTLEDNPPSALHPQSGDILALRCLD
jgi:hypothetical protein